MNYIFSASFMVNSLSMTGLLIALALIGKSDFSADIAIVHAATLALFFSFSGNARALILNSHSTISVKSVLGSRLLIVIPLGITAYWLTAEMAAIPPYLAIVLILRRGVEWLDEIYLSEVERLGAKNDAGWYIFTQAILLITSFLWITFDLPWSLIGLFLWAVFPLLLSLRFYQNNFPSLNQMLDLKVFMRLLPHIGSTAIIGISVYIFRLLIITVTNKSDAGDLFTAFAIGGLLGSVFANSVGPSLALHQKRSDNYGIPIVIKCLLGSFLILGVAITTAAYLQFEFLSLTGKSYLFWLATGLSMIAGTIMVFAQMIRHRLLQHHKDRDLFGPDVMINILIVVAVPFTYYIFGLNMMAGLYLFSAVFAYLFYASYEFGEELKSGLSAVKIYKLKIAILAMILIPIFFQIDSGIFNDDSVSFDSHGQLRILPIPLSVVGCFLGILALGNYQHAKFSFSLIFMSFVLMTLTTIITTGKNIELVQSKFIFLLQFLLPMFGFVLGQFFYRRHGVKYGVILSKIWLLILLVLVPLQLICSWIQGQYFLTSYLYVFSIYQYSQYVPTVIVSAFLFTLVNLCTKNRRNRILEFLLILMGLYVVASQSILAMAMFVIGSILIACYAYFSNKDNRLAVITSIAIVISAIYFHCSLDKQTISLRTSSIQLESSSYIQNQVNGSTHKNDAYSDSLRNNDLRNEGIKNTHNDYLIRYDHNLLQLLFKDLQQKPLFWQSYYKDITRDVRTALIGHAERPSRDLSPSAHNYYLDFIFNYGLIAFIPFAGAILITTKLFFNVIRNHQALNKDLLLSTGCLFLIVFYLLIVDNFLNVSLRQPYSGIFTFFLWGMLLSKLYQVSMKVKYSVNK